MISALESLGSKLQSDILSNKITSIKQKTGDSYVCEINFNTLEGTIDFIPKKIIDTNNSNSFSRKYLWIGNIKGNKPQWHITSDNLTYIFNSIPILLQNIKGTNNNNFEKKLIKVNNQFYVSKGKTKYLNTDNLHVNIINNEYIISFNAEDNIDSTKNLNKLLVDQLLEKTKNLNDYYKNISLYTISIDNSLLAEDKEYVEILKNSLAPLDNSYRKGICSICNREGEVTDDTSKFTFKYYNTDKISFASEVTDFAKNFNICNICYQKIVNAENYVTEKLTSYLGNSNIMIIPELIPFSNSDISIEKVFKISNSIISDDAKELANIEEGVLYDSNSYLINIMFYQKRNNFFKIINILPEIPESRILKIRKNLIETHNEFSKIFPSWENSNLTIKGLTIQGFYRTLVLNSNKERNKEALNIIMNLLKFKHIDSTNIIELYLKDISNNYYQQGRINEINIMLMNAYLRFLERLRLIDEVSGKNYKRTGEYDMKETDLTENEFIENAGYTEEQKSLFWMGYAIKKIENIQFLNNIKSKPMLEKINYQGMNFNALEKLVNQIDEKISQYDVYGKNIGYALYMVHSTMSKYSLDSGKWPVTNVSNVFLIMTGYTVASQLANPNKEEIKNGEQNGN